MFKKKKMGYKFSVREKVLPLYIYNNLYAMERRKISKLKKFFVFSFAVIFACGVFFIGFTGGAIMEFNKQAPTLDALEYYNIRGWSRPTFVYSANGEKVREFGIEYRKIIKLTSIPKHLINAVIAAEDARFYNHIGIDPVSIARAIVANLKAKRIKEGGSTITQQLAKNLFLTHERTLRRKLNEALLALKIEARYTKQEILERYLNKVYFGHGVYGVGAAAELYFNKPVERLTLAESALLASIISSPSKYSPFISLKNALKKQKVVLRRMKETGYISRRQLKKALQEEKKLIATVKRAQIAYINKEKLNQASYFLEYLRLTAEKKYGFDLLYRGGLRIYTTLDLEMQNRAEERLRTYLYILNKRLNKKKNMKIEGAVVIMDVHTGEIKALVGGSRYSKDNQFNRATQAWRQVGSAFKPYIYATALENGFSTISLLDDVPIVYEDKNGNRWEPKNYDHKYYNKVTLRKALELSLNVPTVLLLEKIGIDKVIKKFKKNHIKCKINRDLSLALGCFSITPLKLAAAYCPFANGGIAVMPHMIRYIKDSKGNVLEETFLCKEQVFSPEAAYITTSLLEGVVRRGTAYSAIGKKLPPGVHVAGKTGTTNDYVDAWFVGYTPDYVCVVWIGYDKGRVSLGEGACGGRIAAPLWYEIMRPYLNKKEFKQPENVAFADIDPITLKLATDKCPSVIREVFIKGDMLTHCPLEHSGTTATTTLEKILPTTPPILETPEATEEELLFNEL